MYYILDCFQLFFTESLSELILQMSNFKLNEYLHIYPDRKTQYLIEFLILSYMASMV